MWRSINPFRARSARELTPIPESDQPSCRVHLVGDRKLILLAFTEGTSNGYAKRVDLPCPPQEIGAAVLETLEHYGDPHHGPAGDPPYYVVLAGEKNPLSYHKKTSSVGVTWFKKPHQAGRLTWVPGICIDALQRLRRAGSFTGTDIPEVQGIPPTDTERIGREILSMFHEIRERYVG